MNCSIAKDTADIHEQGVFYDYTRNASVSEWGTGVC